MSTLLFVAVGVCVAMLILAIALYMWTWPGKRKKINLKPYEGKNVVILTDDPHMTYLMDGYNYKTLSVIIKKLKLTKDNKFIEYYEHPIHVTNILDIDEKGE